MEQILPATVSGLPVDTLQVTTDTTLAMFATETKQGTDVAKQDQFRQCLCIRLKRSFFAADEEEIPS
jgi:hypothetical protein